MAPLISPTLLLPLPRRLSLISPQAENSNRQCCLHYVTKLSHCTFLGCLTWARIPQTGNKQTRPRNFHAQTHLYRQSKRLLDFGDSMQSNLEILHTAKFSEDTCPNCRLNSMWRMWGTWTLTVLPNANECLPARDKERKGERTQSRTRIYNYN